MTEPSSGFVRQGEIRLYWEQYGASVDPLVVLVAGADGSLATWPTELIDPLVGAGYRVIAYDHRDVGKSTQVDPNEGYRLGDLAADLQAVIGEAGPPAHVVGRSMGGAVALHLCLDAPELVRSLTLFSASPCLGDPEAEGLPGPADVFVEAAADVMFRPPAKTDAEKLDRLVAGILLLAGPGYPTSVQEARDAAMAVFAHGYVAETGHAAAVAASPSLTPRLHEISASCLIINGTADLVVAVEHGRHLVEHLPNAVLVEIEGLGHDTPPKLCQEIAPRLLQHFSASDAAK